ncbi:putative phosphatidate cytidylyltransferase [Helianthus annuus]|nr:putative phosphatidate cytidylyltransferase [Helianthus annuus]
MEARTNLGSLLKILPPVDFCCVYGSSIHPNNNDKSSMEDYILGVSNPQQWHSENLKMNRVHYASWMASVGGAELITKAADRIGVGVHFNPFVSWNNKMYKYGVVSIDDLVEDMLSWKRFYLSGRLQKPVRIIVDNKDITNTNLINLRAASSAALLLLPSKFTERELYAKICSLSYMGDLRMLFAEDKNKIKKIVEGQFELFRNMYKPLVEEYAAKQLLRLSSCGDNQMNISQVCLVSRFVSNLVKVRVGRKSICKNNERDEENMSLDKKPDIHKRREMQLLVVHKAYLVVHKTRDGIGTVPVPVLVPKIQVSNTVPNILVRYGYFGTVPALVPFCFYFIFYHSYKY